MIERKPHPDNALIDELERDGPAPSQGGSSGGDLQRDVGTRAEMDNTAGATRTERPRAQDHPEARNESKGDKAIGRLDPANKS
jgi:hypothetical protein